MITRTMRLHSTIMVNDINDLCLIVPYGSIGIEVGCFTGESSELFIKSRKFQKLICVDPWWDGYYKNHNMREVEASFDERMTPYNGKVVKIKSSSDVMSLPMADNKANFIYIDGNHGYDHVKADIINGLRILKESGSEQLKILAGHDYKFAKSPGVEKAVKEILGFPDIRFAGYSWAKIIR
jgi:hypothetical protein